MVHLWSCTTCLGGELGQIPEIGFLTRGPGCRPKHGLVSIKKNLRRVCEMVAESHRLRQVPLMKSLCR